MISALKAERNSVGVEIDPEYCKMIYKHLKSESTGLFSKAEIIFEKLNIYEKRTHISENIQKRLAPVLAHSPICAASSEKMERQWTH